MFAQENPHKMPTETINIISAEERILATNDLHAVSDPLDESRDAIDIKLSEMDTEVAILEDKEAYREAVQQCSAYVHSWRLRFLRAERYHPVRAAERMVRHFETKNRLFGKDALGRDVTVGDLSKPEVEYLKTGAIQILPKRDCGGRAVLMDIVRAGATPNILEAKLKLQFLLATHASQDIEVQKKGLVFILYALGEERNILSPADRIIQEIQSWDSLPVRLVGLHTCYNDPLVNDVMTLVSREMNPTYLCRHRCHFGNHLECQSNLASYGIPRHIIPIFSDGSIDCTFHVRWMRQQAMHNQELPMTTTRDSGRDKWNKNKEALIAAKYTDVVLGRGQRKHFGNQRLRRFLAKHLVHYETVSWLNKRCLRQMLFGQLTKSGIRFVIPTENGGYERICDRLAMEKIAHGFRDLRREARRAGNSVPV